MTVGRIGFSVFLAGGLACAYVPQAVAQTQTVCAEPPPGTLTVPKVLHLAGIAGVPRNSSGDLVLNDLELTFQAKKSPRVSVAYVRVDLVQFSSSSREKYANAAMGAAIATPFGLGGLLMAAKRNVELMVVDYRNEGGGLLGLVMQLPKDSGTRVRGWLTACELPIEGPPPNPAQLPEQR